MKRILGTMAVVLLLTGTAMAAPTMTLGDVVFNDATHVMYLDLLMVSNGGSAKLVSSFNSALKLTGTDASKFTQSAASVAGITETTMAGLVAPATYAWNAATFGATSTVSSAPGTGANMPGETFVHAKAGTATGRALSSVGAGEVLARYYFTYTGLKTEMTQVLVTVGATTYSGSPKFSFTDFSSDTVGAVAREGAGTYQNGDNIIPEPATMGLLGLGLVGLIMRRKGKK